MIRCSIGVGRGTPKCGIRIRVDLKAVKFSTPTRGIKEDTARIEGHRVKKRVCLEVELGHLKMVEMGLLFNNFKCLIILITEP
jgi:hypothetical protein